MYTKSEIRILTHTEFQWRKEICIKSKCCVVNVDRLIQFGSSKNGANTQERRTSISFPWGRTERESYKYILAERAPTNVKQDRISTSFLNVICILIVNIRKSYY